VNGKNSTDQGDVEGPNIRLAVFFLLVFSVRLLHGGRQQLVVFQLSLIGRVVRLSNAVELFLEILLGCGVRHFHLDATTIRGPGDEHDFLGCASGFWAIVEVEHDEARLLERRDEFVEGAVLELLL